MGVILHDIDKIETGVYFLSVDVSDEDVPMYILGQSNACCSTFVAFGRVDCIPPHGDLIDRREAIIDANERAYDFWLSDDEVNATIQFLKEQPTIIPAEEGE